MKYTVVGIPDKLIDINREVSDTIASHKYFSGGKRHYNIVKHILPENHIWIEITVPIDGLIKRYSEIDSDMVVFASGDPLFYGFANTLLSRIPDADVVVKPYFNSLQMLAHRVPMPYQDMKIVSCTGRPWKELDNALIRGEEKIGVLTDRKKTPDVIAKRLIEFGYTNYKVIVGEQLGNDNEAIHHLSLNETSDRTFSDLNNLILIKEHNRIKYFGIPETEFNILDGRPKMITKMPVRLTTLAMMELNRREVFWDIGFCTGSVSIEVRLQFPHLDIFAWEKRANSEQLISSNIIKFGAQGIDYCEADFINSNLDSIKQPDAIFIGGHGGRMRDIFTKVYNRLKTGGVLAINSVSESSKQEFRTLTQEFGFKSVNEQIVQSNDDNPITIIVATK
ncbi:MAG: precorrin-6y C5,15-methyltransferase (decarboxylating) subunit CbiE [Bacteroidales bacterium]|jgi:precorrin-6Y C5,15-methyltransferase (decarboxylating)|nr:precorrin-6y C5,15-methyltransferase (decarboxylating) subunit CbiE [Bacteroidales bacterium]